MTAILHLYAPDAVVHFPDGDRAGHRAVQRSLEGSALLGVRHSDIEVREEGSMAHVHWRSSKVDVARTPILDRRTSTRLRVEHGQIVEQWT